MYNIDQLSNAAAQLTGESLGGARRRLGRQDRYNHLIPAAPQEQALLESVLATALGATDGPTRPFGIREAKPSEDGLTLRLERTQDIESLLQLLPYRAKKSPWRGVRGLTVRTAGSKLRFAFRPWLYERSWHTPGATVWVAGPHGDNLADLLARHETQIRSTGGNPQWDPQHPEAGPKRQEPVARNLIRQLAASGELGSALLRRPRLWDSLAGHTGIQLKATMADHGLDWVIDRRLAGPHLHDDRLIEVVTDHIAGFRMGLLDHTCDAEKCTMRFAPQTGTGGGRGLLVIHSHAEPRPRNQVPGPRPLTVIGDRRPTSRHPARPGRPGRPGRPATERPGSVIHLMGRPRPDGMNRTDLAWVAEQIAATWTAQGLAAALLVRTTDFYVTLGDPNRPDWVTSGTPLTAPAWRRLRLAQPPGELWYLEAPLDDEEFVTAVKHARASYARTLVVDRIDEWPADPETHTHLYDARVLAHRARAYERHIPLPAAPGEDSAVVRLTPTESAVQWRQRELGGWMPKGPVTGMLVINAGRREPAEPDEFDRAVEAQLARFGMPVLGRFPANPFIARGSGHSPHPPTVLDPPTERPTHAQMLSAVKNLDRGLWPATAAAAVREP
ncbi:hypothetical protein [Streptomyces xiamenensis]|uniref:hypothetical protein n=1 Tax=Streptomyces xiamenensis TaxID=408015 RepID=UPI0035E3313E